MKNPQLILRKILNGVFATNTFQQSRNTDSTVAIPKPEAATEIPVGRVRIRTVDKIKNYIHQHPKLRRGAKIAAGTAAVVIGKKLWDRHQANKSVLNQTKAFTRKNGKKVAAGTLAALGAGIGVKALLKYLRKKKEQ